MVALSTSPKWLELTIKTNYYREDKARAFSLIKNLLCRAVYESFFYTWSYEDDKIVIKLRILEYPQVEVENGDRLLSYLKELAATKVVTFYTTDTYYRNHILPALEKSSKLAVALEFLPSREDAAYLVHCVLENLFLNNEEEIEVYEDLIRRVRKKIANAKK